MIFSFKTNGFRFEIRNGILSIPSSDWGNLENALSRSSGGVVRVATSYFMLEIIPGIDWKGFPEVQEAFWSLRITILRFSCSVRTFN